MTVFGIHAAYLAVDYRPQMTKRCCWAAAIEKVSQLIGQRITQEDLLTRFSALSDGAKVEEITEVLNIYMVERKVRLAWIPGDLKASAVWWDEIERQLRRKTPLIALIVHPRKKVHAVVLAAVKIHQTQGVMWYGAYDPNDQFTAPIQIEKSYMDEFLRMIILPYRITN